MTLRDVNLKLVLLLALAAAGIITCAFVLWFQERNLANEMEQLLAEIDRATEFSLLSGKLVDVVERYERSLLHESEDVQNTFREEIRELQRQRRQLASGITLPEARNVVDGLESRISLWLDQSVYYSGTRPGKSSASTIERHINRFTREYRREGQRSLTEVAEKLRRASLNTLFMVALALLVGTLWLAYMITGLWQPMRQLQEKVLTKLGEQDVQAATVAVPALETSVNKLFKRLDEARSALNIVNSITEGLIIVSPDGRIQSANKSILTMLGFQEKELIGKEFSDIYVKIKSVHVQGFFKKQDTYKEEELFKTREGKVIPVRFSSSFLFDEDMEVLGFVCIAKDITKEKRVEEELQKQNDWFKVTLASIGDAVITTDAEGNVNFANQIACQMVGLKSDEGLNVPLDDVFKLRDIQSNEPITVASPRELANKEQHQPREHLLVRGEQHIYIDCIHAPIVTAGGGLFGAVMVFRDITEARRNAIELQEAKENAEHALQVKTQFLANMSHEIRTPMNGVMGMTDLLLESDLTAAQMEVAQIIRTSSEALLTLLNDILDFSKIEAGKLELESVSFEIRRLVEEVGDLMGRKAQEKDLELILLIHHDVPGRMVGDPGRLRQILLNLVSNAVKFTSRGEIVIELSLREMRGSKCFLQCSIKDTGIGIPRDRMDRLFEVFSQMDASTTRKYGGSGLGLAICRELCNAMGGDIWVESQEGEGSTFFFTVLQEIDPRPPLKRPHVDLMGLRILVAESNEENRKAIRYQLNHYGCKVDEVARGTEIRERLEHQYMIGEPYHLIILDYALEQGDVFELARGIKKDERFKQTGVLLVTSVPFQISGKSKWSPHVDGFLTKPLKLRLLYQSVSAIVGAASEPDYESRNEPLSDYYQPNHNEYHILLVEDNPVNQKVTAQLLTNAGYRCDIAANGLEALEAVEQTEYHLILMDCQMPEMDGFQATREIRERYEKEALPIVAMTANAMKGDRERCLKVGMNDYLSKPVRKHLLFETLGKYLNQEDQVSGIR